MADAAAKEADRLDRGAVPDAELLLAHGQDRLASGKPFQEQPLGLGFHFFRGHEGILPHPEALAVADAEDLAAAGAEINVSSPEKRGNLAAPQFPDRLAAMRTERRHVFFLDALDHDLSSTSTTRPDDASHRRVRPAAADSVSFTMAPDMAGAWNARPA